MSRNYRYDHRLKRHRKHQTIYILAVSCLIVAGLIGLLINSLQKATLASNTTVQGPAKIVQQASTDTSTQTSSVSEPDYSLALPAGWTLYKTTPTISGSIITWRSGANDDNTRTLTIYEDAIPKTYAVNLMMPVTVEGNGLEVGAVSTNCTNFTTENSTSSYDTTPSTWDGVNFLCNTPNRFDDQVGTGVAGSSINTITITGPTKGTHAYFFLYIDRDAEPDYAIFFSILDSFKAK